MREFQSFKERRRLGRTQKIGAFTKIVVGSRRYRIAL